MYLPPQISFIVMHHGHIQIYECNDNYDKSIRSPSLNGAPSLGLLLNVTGVAEHQEDLIHGGRISNFGNQEGVDVRGFGG